MPRHYRGVYSRTDFDVAPIKQPPCINIAKYMRENHPYHETDFHTRREFLDVSAKLAGYKHYDDYLAERKKYGLNIRARGGFIVISGDDHQKLSLAYAIGKGFSEEDIESLMDTFTENEISIRKSHFEEMNKYLFKITGERVG